MVNSGIAPAGGSGVSLVGSGHCRGFLTEGPGGEPRRVVWGLIRSAPVTQPVVELGGGHGPGHEIALRLVAAQSPQLGVGDFGLDAFGDDAQAEAVGQTDRGGDQCGGAGGRNPLPAGAVLRTLRPTYVKRWRRTVSLPSL
jgi:hypothetical protein